MLGLTPRYVLGFQSKTKDSIRFVEESTVVYPAGHSCVVFNMENKAQKFICGSPDSEAITALSVSLSRKYLAVAERGQKGIISIYDLQSLKKRKVLISTDAGSREYISMSFSPDSKLLAALGGPPEWNLSLWVWEKAKLASVVRASNQQGSILFQCQFCPSDINVVSVCGEGVLKLYKISDNNLKQLPGILGKKEVSNYVCHTWYCDGEHDKLIVSAESGEVLCIEGSEIKFVIDSEDQQITSIASYQKGFVTGCSNGSISVYEKDEKDGFRKSKQLNVVGQQFSVSSLAISPTDENLVLALENGQLFSLAFNNIEIFKSDEMNFDYLVAEFHMDVITGLDVATTKPIVATCSLDKSVRIWNYQDKSKELIKYFQEEAFSLAIHPNGMMLLVGFLDKLRLMAILIDDFRSYREFNIKACREVKFSNGAGNFAAVNGNTIQLYNSYSCENIGNLRGHNGKVKCIQWAFDDTKLVSCGTDGAIYVWRVKDFKREKENVQKGCSYSTISTIKDGHNIFATGSDLKLKEIEEIPSQGLQISKEYSVQVNLTSLALPQVGRTLFTATEQGVVRTYKFPLTGEYHDLKCFNGSITRMQLTTDDNQLFVVGEDGCLYQFEVKEKDSKAISKREQEKIPFIEEVLVSKQDLEERKNRTVELETSLSEQFMQNEYQLRMKEMEFNEKLREQSEKYISEIEGDKSKFELLLQEKNETELEYEEKIKYNDEKHQLQLSALDSQYQQKIVIEVERYQQLMHEKNNMSEKWDEQNILLIESHEQSIQALTEEYEMKLKEDQSSLTLLREENEETRKEYLETKIQIEEDVDREVDDLKIKYEAKLNFERENCLRLKGENGLMKKKFSQLQKDIESYKEDIQTQFMQKKELYNQIASLEKDIFGLKKEIRERDETIGDKEKRIYDLKKKNQELEKFKFVLDHKIKELKAQIEPKETEIEHAKDQIQCMDKELEKYHLSNCKLDLTISDLRQKQIGLQQEVLSQRTSKNDAQYIVKQFQYDLHAIIDHLQDYSTLQDMVQQLYQKYAVSSSPTVQFQDDSKQECNQQLIYLESNLDKIKSKLNQDKELYHVDNMRVMFENISLISEVNDLRRQLKLCQNGAILQQKDHNKDLLSSQSNQTGNNDVHKQLSQCHMQITELQNQIAISKEKIYHLEQQVVPRPISREKVLKQMQG